MRKVVGIGGYAYSDRLDDELMTHALGSCVALIMRCPKTLLTAMAHIVLPTLERPDQVAYLKDKPAYFASNIVPQMVQQFKGMHCRLEDLEVTLVGGALAHVPKDQFEVGIKNINEVQSLLRLYQVPFDSTHTRGHVSRSVSVCVADGYIHIRHQNMLL